MKRLLQNLDNLGLLLLVGAALYYTVTNQWDKWVLGTAIAGGLLVAIGIGANYRQILQSLGKRSTKFATNYAVSVVLAVALVSGVNFMGQRHPKRFDLTSIGRFTLADQTIQILNKLKQDLTIKAFFPGGDYPPLKDLFVEFRTRSRNIKYEFIDPDKQPDVAKQYDVKAYGTFQNPFTGSTLKFGTVILLYGEKKEKVEKRSEEVREEDLTNAIIKVTRTEAKKIYFVQGHGEKDPNDTERNGYSASKKALEEQGFKVETVNLAAEAKVPVDAKVLVMAGPATEPFPQEMQVVSDFLNRGGGVLILLDPSPAPGLNTFLKDWGVTVDNDIVLDVSGVGRLMGAGPAIPLVRSYEGHKITDRFKLMSFFPLTRSVQPSKESVSGITVESIFKSDPNSWGEMDVKKLEASFDEKVDLKGPLSLAVAVTKEVKAAAENVAAIKARMVVVGDSDFASNGYFPQGQGNANLFQNMVSWLALDEDLISIRPKQPTDRRLTLAESQKNLLRLVTIFILPGIVLVAGITVWSRRRR